MATEQTVAVCPTAAWRDAPFVGEPASRADFRPDDEDFDWQEYAMGVGKSNVISISFLFVSVGVLLIFLMWRFFNCLCGACCCAKGCEERRMKNADIVWRKTATALKIIVAILAVALIALGAYGMANLDVGLTNDAWKVVDKVQKTTEGLIGAANNTVNDLADVGASLDEVEALFNEDINLEKIGENLDCVGNMLDNTPDTDSLKTSLDGLDTSLTTTLPPKVTALETALEALKSDTVGKLVDPIKDVSAAKGEFTTLATDLQAIDDAITALPASHSAAADAKVAELATAISDLGDMDIVIDNVNELKASLKVIQDDVSVTPIDDIDTAVQGITSSLDSIGTDVDTAAGALKAFSDWYGEYGPCLDDIVERMLRINDEVIGLPTAALDSVKLLKDTSTSLKDFFQDADPSPADMVKNLEKLKDALALPDGTADFTTQLGDVKTQIETTQNEAGGIQTNLNSLLRSLGDIKTGLDTVQTQLDAYPSPGTPAAYTALKNGLTASDIQSNVKVAVIELNGITTSFSDTFTAADSLATELPAVSADLDAQLANIATMKTQLDAVTGLDGIASAIDSVKSAFDGLGADPLAEPRSMIAEVQTLVTDTVDSVRQMTTDAIGNARGQVDNAHEQIIGAIKDVRTDYEDLSNEVNHNVYVATLVLYVFSIVFVVLIALFIIINCQFGVCMFLFLLMDIIFLYFLISTIMGTGMIVMNDGCHNVEVIAVEKVSDSNEKMLPVVEYYLFNKGDSVKKLLKDSDLIDLDQILDDAITAKDDVIAQLTKDWNPKEKLQGILDNMETKVDGLLEGIDEFLVKVSAGKIHPLYVDIKSYFCCNVPNVMNTIWRDLTIAGGLSLLTILFAFGSLSLLDRMPNGGCCGCSCHKKPGYDRVPATPQHPPTQFTPPKSPRIDTTLV